MNTICPLEGGRRVLRQQTSYRKSAFGECISVLSTKLDIKLLQLCAYEFRESGLSFLR
jgi:hypothetical protein